MSNELWSPPQRTRQLQHAKDWSEDGGHDPQAVIDAIVGTQTGAQAATQIGYQRNSSRVSPSSSPWSGREKKEYCTYWIRHGECDYMQQGCLYRHEMPDKVTLQKIGLRNTPRWWLEKNLALKHHNKTVIAAKPSAWLSRAEHHEIKSDSSTVGLPDIQGPKDVAANQEHIMNHIGVDRGAFGQSSKETVTESSTDSDEEYRKLSVVGDLIDFGLLLPTPPSPTSPATSSCSTYNGSQFDNEACSGVKYDFVPTGERAEYPRKIFIPFGEDRDAHVAEAEKIAIRGHKSCHHANTKAKPASSDESVQQLKQKKGDNKEALKRMTVPTRKRWTNAT